MFGKNVMWIFKQLDYYKNFNSMNIIALGATYTSIFVKQNKNEYFLVQRIIVSVPRRYSKHSVTVLDFGWQFHIWNVVHEVL